MIITSIITQCGNITFVIGANHFSPANTIIGAGTNRILDIGLRFQTFPFVVGKIIKERYIAGQPSILE